jgi:hypothetical protein
MIATHLTELIKKHAHEILGRQEVQQLVDTIKKDYPVVVDELLGKARSALAECRKYCRISCAKESLYVIWLPFWNTGQLCRIYQQSGRADRVCAYSPVAPVVPGSC